MDLDLKGRTVIVTGGGSNIGRGIFLAFAKEGANVINAEIDEKQGQRVIDEAAALRAGGRSVLVRTDVTDWDSVQAMVKKTLGEFGRIDVLVNNVGTPLPGGPFVEKRREDWEKELSMAFWSGINCIKAVVPHMIDRKHGAIVNIGSDAGRVGEYQMAVYSATKGAVIAITKALAMELGPLGIRVNCVCPSLTVPESPEHVGDGSSWKQWSSNVWGTAEMQKRFKDCPLGRLGRPEDVANVVVFVASDCASYVTGQTISVNGGRVMV